jgi:misacylated tRNA(Ala) deacylase
MISNPKKYDPQMHTAEHILNQTMVRMFNKGRSFSNHIERKKSKCDYHFDRNLTEEEISLIQEKVNSVISENFNVSEQIIKKSEALEKYNLVNLPDENADTIRIIRVGDYDACPCSGPHVSNTSEIGKFRIISTSYENNILRVRFKLNRDK